MDQGELLLMLELRLDKLLRAYAIERVWGRIGRVLLPLLIIVLLTIALWHFIQ